MRSSTQCVNFDRCPGDPFRPASTPLYQTATFEQESATSFGAYDYSRSGNPTRQVLEDQLARLEGGRYGFAFSSGMAALSTLLRLLEAGDEILAGRDLYGGSFRLITRIASRFGIQARFVDTSDRGAVESALSERTRILLLETPSNPLQKISDIEALASVMHERGGYLAVDNTFLSPWLQNPLAHGADIVLHSATKHLCGHSDVTAGCLMTNDASVAESMSFAQNAEGNALGPFDCWLLLRGVKTLALRLERQQESARRLAEFLRRHPAVTRVHYAGSQDHPGYFVHRRQARGGGSVVSFETGSRLFSKKLVESTKLCAITVSFGGLHSSLSLPCFMSHASIPEKVRREHALPEDLVRLSVGIEDVGDLEEDLAGALERAAE